MTYEYIGLLVVDQLFCLTMSVITICYLFKHWFELCKLKYELKSLSLWQSVYEKYSLERNVTHKFFPNTAITNYLINLTCSKYTIFFV